MDLSIPRTTGISRETKGEREETTEQVKHTIQLPASLWGKLEKRARVWGVTKSEALRRAVWFFNYVAEAMDDEAEIIVRRRDGKEERLVISPY